ncbi:MAG: hypothetical protein H0W72_12240, partial [Planctomycetes bacterium]|nr:hypothetical protein [Planctomycetota bacterium]
DAPIADYAFVGMKVGAPTGGRRIRRAEIRPRHDQPDRMIGSAIQGSHDNGVYVDLATISSSPVADGTYTVIPIASTEDWQFLRWRGAGGSYGNIADLKFFNAGGEVTGIAFGTPGEYDDGDATTDRSFAAAFDNTASTFSDLPVGAAPGPYVGIEVTGGPADSVGTAPVITSTAPTAAVVGQLYSYTIVATGSPAPTFGVSGNPGWLTLSGSVLSGTPTAVGATGMITVTASNGTSPDDSEAFVIAVTATALPPAGVVTSGGKGCGLGGGIAVLVIGLSLGFVGRRERR